MKSDIEERLFWAVYHAQSVFGRKRVKTEAQFEFNRKTGVVKFGPGEINDFIHRKVFIEEPVAMKKFVEQIARYNHKGPLICPPQ